MDTASPTASWKEAYRGFLLHLKANRAPKTVRFYATQLGGVYRWALGNDISLAKFGKTHLDAYLSERLDKNISRTTLHHDALCAKVFLKWCVKNDLLDRSLLADYEVRKAPAPAKYMPTQEDMGTLLAGLQEYWDGRKNPHTKYLSSAKREFHCERNYAIVLTLLDSACRIGEVLSFTLEDYRENKDNAELTVRVSKGREPRSIPVSDECREAIAAWLKVRRKIMKDVPKAEDAGYLFISETGGRIDEGRFSKTLHKGTEFAGLSEKITLHSLRRFSLNRLAKHNLLMAQTIAGHKETKTTLLYTKIDPDLSARNTSR
jgi:site-specific recombinase XerD